MARVVKRPVAVRVGGMASVDEALIKACFNGPAREVRRLLSGAADVNYVNEKGLTPLMAASMMCHAEMVDMLLAAEANVNAVDVDGCTALFLAALYCASLVNSAVMVRLTLY